MRGDQGGRVSDMIRQGRAKRTAGDELFETMTAEIRWLGGRISCLVETPLGRLTLMDKNDRITLVFRFVERDLPSATYERSDKTDIAAAWCSRGWWIPAGGKHRWKTC